MAKLMEELGFHKGDPKQKGSNVEIKEATLTLDDNDSFDLDYDRSQDCYSLTYLTLCSEFGFLALYMQYSWCRVIFFLRIT